MPEPIIIMCSTDLFLGLLAILFPPLPVWVKRGICSADSIINILLLILGYLPGLIHAWYIIAKYPDLPYDYEYHQGAHHAEHGCNNSGRVYVFVHDGQGGSRRVLANAPQNQQPKLQTASQHGNNMNYGATAASNSQQAGGLATPSRHEEGVAAAGPSDGSAPPPSYAQVVAGDHKIQTQE